MSAVSAGRFQCQDMWTRNKCSKNTNFSSQLKYEYTVKEQDKEQEKEQDLCSDSGIKSEVSAEWAFCLEDLWQLSWHCMDLP